MKKIITGIVTALAVSSFSIAIPAHATTSSSPVQNSVKTQPKARLRGSLTDCVPLTLDGATDRSFPPGGGVLRR